MVFKVCSTDRLPMMDWSGTSELFSSAALEENQQEYPQQGPHVQPATSGNQTGTRPSDPESSAQYNTDQLNQKENGKPTPERYHSIVNKYRSRARRRQAKLDRLQRSGSPPALSVSDILAATSKILPPKVQELLHLQLRGATTTPRGMRYTDSEVATFLAQHYHGPRAYAHLRKTFFLPTPRILRKRIEHIQLPPGFHEPVMDILKERFRDSPAADKLVVLSFDEMALKRGLKYVRGHDRIDGFEDLGSMGRTRRQADHVLVFMARGITQRWKQPLGYFFTSGAAPAKVMEPLLVDVIRKLRAAGMTVAATVCDMGTPNQELHRRLGVTAASPSFKVDDADVVALHDVPHLFKCVRNALYKHNVEVDGSVAKWDHIRQFFEEDRKRPIRAAPRLTAAHVRLKPFKKMQVRLATQVLSHSVAAGLQLYSSVGKLTGGKSISCEENSLVYVMLVFCL